MRYSFLRRCAMTIHSVPPGSPMEQTRPVAVSSTFGSEGRSISDLAALEEERRVARQKKLFEDLIVFDGGAVADHERLGDRMIMREFVHYAMYHKKWGYYPKLFRKYRELVTGSGFDPVPFGSLRNQHDYDLYVGKLHECTPSYVTPTQLFQPYYSWVLAEYCLGTMRAKFQPEEPLVVYDVGCGTGAFANHFLNFLAEHYPQEYERCEYHVVEMNPQMIPVLRNRLVHHYHHVKVHNISFLNWRLLDPRRCFVLGIELLSTMPHDCIVWDARGNTAEMWMEFPQRDNLGDAKERYLSVKDPMVLRYLRYLNWLQEETFHALKVLTLTNGRDNIDPNTRGGLEPHPEFDSVVSGITKMLDIHSPFRTAWLPTATMTMLEHMTEFLPRHNCFFADWSKVGVPLPGLNGPLCQSKMRLAKDLYVRRASDSFNSNAGMVDICFPTDFEHLAEVYRRIAGDHREIVSMPHPNFWKTFGGDKTALFATCSGFNPLLDDFGTFHVFASLLPSEC